MRARVSLTSAGTRACHITEQVSDFLRPSGSDKSNQISSLSLLPLNSLEERLEISGAKAREIVSLDDLNEDRGTIKEVLLYTVSLDNSTGRQPGWLTFVKSCKR